MLKSILSANIYIYTGLHFCLLIWKLLFIFQIQYLELLLSEEVCVCQKYISIRLWLLWGETW